MMNREELQASFMRFVVTEGPARWTVILLLSIAIFFLVAIIWASVAYLDEVTKAIGQVISSSKTQVVQNLEGGILKAILTQEGDAVTKGQILLRIDDTTAAANYRENKGRYFNLLAMSVRLRVESEANPFTEIHETMLEFDPELKNERPDIVKSETDLFKTRHRELKSSLQILQQQLTQREKEIQELQSRETHLKTGLGLAKQEVAILEPLVSKGVASKMELLRLQREVNQLQSDLSATELSVIRGQVAIQESTEKIRDREAQFHSEALTLLNDTLSKLSSLRESMTAVQDRVIRTDVRSPVNGVVKQLFVHTIGEVVQPGASLIEVVPIEDTLLIEARVAPADIAFLQTGQEAEVKVTAYDFYIYGGLKGILEQISADTILTKEGEQFYKIRVRTDKNHLGTEYKPLYIKPGMLVEVDILTGKKTILQYLLKPISRGLHHAMRER